MVGVLWFGALLLLSSASEFRDTAAIPAFRRLDPNLARFATIFRARADETCDVLLILGSPRPVRDSWWSRDGLLGLFLQDRAHPDRVYELSLRHRTIGDLRVEVARYEPGALTLACRPEYGSGALNLKFFFDARTKRIRREAQYLPFRASYAVEERGAPVFIAENTKELLALRPNEYGGFDILHGPEATRILTRVPVSEWWTPGERFRVVDRKAVPPARFGPQSRFSVHMRKDASWGQLATGVEERSATGPRVYRLPQSTCAEFKLRRPGEFKLNGCPQEILEEIGPSQVFEGRLWFARSFYDSEGNGGIGAFGYFDPTARKYELFSPPEIADWSGSALLVEKDAVWISLWHRGEYGGSPGGLLRWDRATHRITRCDIGVEIDRILRYRDRLYLATSEGLAILRNGAVLQFLIDQTFSGEYRVMPRYQ